MEDSALALSVFLLLSENGTQLKKLSSCGVVVKNLFVGNLDSMVTQAELRRLFEAYGQVAPVHVIVDRNTGVPRIQELNGSVLRGRTLNVEYARPRPECPAA